MWCPVGVSLRIFLLCEGSIGEKSTTGKQALIRDYLYARNTSCVFRAFYLTKEPILIVYRNARFELFCFFFSLPLQSVFLLLRAPRLEEKRRDIERLKQPRTHNQQHGLAENFYCPVLSYRLLVLSYLWQKHPHTFAPSKNQSFQVASFCAVFDADESADTCAISVSVVSVFANSRMKEKFPE